MMSPSSRVSPTVCMMALCVLGCAGSVDDTVRTPTSSHGRAASAQDSSTEDVRDPVMQSPDSAHVARQMANPADVKCEQAGHRVEHVRANGVPIRSLCVNDATGAKCDTWAFYREECSLERLEQYR